MSSDWVPLSSSNMPAECWFVSARTRQADEVEADADADSCRREDEAPQGCEEGFQRVLVLVGGSLSSCVADLS